MKRILLFGIASLCMLSLSSCALVQNLLGAGARSVQNVTRAVTG